MNKGTYCSDSLVSAHLVHGHLMYQRIEISRGIWTARIVTGVTVEFSTIISLSQ